MYISKEQYKLVTNYLNQYNKLYSQETLQKIIDDLDKNISYTNCCFELMQVYNLLNVIPDNSNIYQYILSYLMDNFDIINYNILDINGGPYPLLAKYIAKEQKKFKCGKITVLEPDLILRRLSHVTLSRKSFSLKHDIKNYDLLMSIRPNLDNDIIIRQANLYHKEFFLIGGENINPRGKNGFYDPRNWNAYINQLASEDSRDFIIDKVYLPKPFNSNNFILTKKKKCNSK